MTNRRRAIAALIGIGAAAIASPIRAQESPAQVTVGITNSTTDAALLIADRLGYFRDEGITAQLLPFDSAAKMMAPAAAGQLDVAAGAPSAALYNAIATKVNLKIVADKGSAARDYGFQPILVSKALMASGRYHSAKDLKGLRFAEGAQGTAAAAMVSRFLAGGGLRYDDIEHVYLSFPAMITAFTNGAIDAAAVPEPNATIAERLGSAVRVMGNDRVYPNQQLTVLMYGGAFIANRRDVARRFMIAYVKAARFYNDALIGGHLRGRTADDVINVLVDVTKNKDRTIFRAMTASANDPNGRVNVASLRDDLEFFKTRGLVTDKTVSVDAALDPSFAEAAVKALGPYHPRK